MQNYLEFRKKFRDLDLNLGASYCRLFQLKLYEYSEEGRGGDSAAQDRTKRWPHALMIK